MRFIGTRRARGLTFILVFLLCLGLWRVARLYVDRLLQDLGPTLLARAEESLQREIAVERLDTSRPGIVVAEGVRVARGKTLVSGVLVTVGRLEMTYDPALLAWGSLI